MNHGLSDAPSVFQRYINNVFRDLINKKVLIVYMDNFLVPAENAAERLQKLQRVRTIASEYDLEFNL